MSSPIPALSPKRTNRAIEASTMRSALETTQVRRRNRASQCRPLAGMVALDAVGLLVADEQPPRRDQLGIRRPVVRAIEAGLPTLHAFQEPAQGAGVTTPALP